MNYSIIAISCEHGSGRRLIAEQLSKNLGIPFYDKELIDLAAKGTYIIVGRCADYVLRERKAAYYNYYASSPWHWGERQNYQLMIDSSIGIDMVCKMICSVFQGGGGGVNG